MADTFLGRPVRYVDKIEGCPDVQQVAVCDFTDYMNWQANLAKRLQEETDPVTDTDPGVRIDTAHAKLLEGLVCAHKPSRVLEFGFGGGRSAEAILRGLEFNQQAAEYTLVDNWHDWTGVMPADAAKFLAVYGARVRLVQMAEREFVANSLLQYDFIMSDADHTNTHRWFGAVYDTMLVPGGVLIYHDCRNFPGIASIVTTCEERGLRFVVFDANSRGDEACQRGLLCIFKPVE